MVPLWTVSAASRASRWGRSHSEKFNARRPSVTSRWMSQETGARALYQGQTVSLL